MNQTKTKKCIVCGKKFEYRTERGGHNLRMKSFRNKRALTCSPQCSKIYVRIYTKICAKFCYHIKKNARLKERVAETKISKASH